MNKSFITIFPIWLILVILLLPAIGNAQTCDISVSGTKGCIPFSVRFSATSTATILGYNWYFGDNDSSGQIAPSHIYGAHGKYSPYVVLSFINGKKCTAKVTKPIIVNDSPKVNFNYADKQVIIVCDNKQKICFTDLSKPGSDGAPIKNRLWTFGDGSPADFSKAPCHVYDDTGKYKITLQVTDTNGCQNLVQRNIIIKLASNVLAPLNPKFKLGQYYDCKKNAIGVLIHNVTDSSGANIVKYIWDFDDGTFDSCYIPTGACKDWLDVSHVYTKSGSVKPSLTIINKYGCSSKFTFDTAIIIVPPYKLAIKMQDVKGCFVNDSTVHFEAPSHLYASYYMWNFNDPYSPGTGRFPAMDHTYKKPGVYTVEFKAKIGNCIFDTVLCQVVRLMGPKAKIELLPASKAPWDSIPPGGSFYVPLAKYPSFFDTSCTAKSSVTYYTYSTVTIKNGDTTYDVCKYDTLGYTFKTTYTNCDTTKPVKTKVPIVKTKIKSVKDRVDTIATAYVWIKGSGLPSGKVYSKPPLVNRPLYMDDTSLFSMTCGAPHRVKFTNFSTKYRGYDAIDNEPPGSPDTCRHKDYPYASDSLSYKWDFREGNASIISTKKNHSDTSQFSQERLPMHLFRKAGCYWVKLEVYDPVTGCYSEDSIPVVMQQPDAGWAPEYSNIKQMTYGLQQTLPAKGPRRGLILYGRPCVRDTQALSLNETLPSCYKRQYAVVFDSAASAKKCNGKVSWQWLDKREVEQKLQNIYRYPDSGWKTLGLVVSNNANCTDTMWYHNYKYIFKVDPSVHKLPDMICVGDILKSSLNTPEQLGIKLFTQYYVIEKDKYDTVAKLRNDTLPFMVKAIKLRKDTITSTVHNINWGIDDGALNFNSQYDTFSKKIPVAGHLTVISVIRNRFGCFDTARQYVSVGHDAIMSVSNQVLCTHDTAQFYGIANYFLPFKKAKYGYDIRPFWDNPDSVRGGRKPAIAEQMRWDLDGDGKIDYTGTSPRFSYSKPGIYTVRLYTRDSLGCEQVTEQKNYIKVIDVVAKFGVAAPGPVKVCAPQFFTFHDSSYVVDPGDSIKLKIKYWKWDFGDGSAPIVITDTNKRSPTILYPKNGTYFVKLTVGTDSSVGVRSGCASTFILKVIIKGPRAEYKIIGPTTGCAPFTLTMHDLYPQGKVHIWKLGDGTTISSNGEDTVKLVYKRPGTYCPGYYVADSVVDYFGNKLFCYDTFPVPYCKYKVVVYPLNVFALKTTDSILCVGVPATFKSTVDTGYTSWNIDYGDGNTANAGKPTFNHAFARPGKYTVKLTGNGAKCPDSSSLKVRVVDVKSAFYIDSLKNDTPNIAFVNTSVNGVRFIWYFDDGTPPYQVNDTKPFFHTYEKDGKRHVCLAAYNFHGCVDSFCRDIEIITNLKVYNVFTPNADPQNNHFIVDAEGITFYHLQIFNRWGELVFESNDKHNTWDGNNTKTGSPYPEGIYYYVLDYKLIGHTPKQLNGSVTLLR